MRSRLRVVSGGRSGRLLDLFEALESSAGELPGPELLEAIGRAGRLEAMLRARYSAAQALVQQSSAAPRYLDAVETAAYLGVSRSTVLRLAKAGKLPACQLSEGVVRFDREALDAYATTTGRSRPSG